MTRATDALAVRDWCLLVLQRRGRRVALQGIPLTMAKAGDLSLAVTDAKEFTDADAKFLSPDDGPQPSGMTLDVWAKGQGKVLSLSWDEEGDKPLKIRSFARGPWEALCRGEPPTVTEPMMKLHAEALSEAELRARSRVHGAAAHAVARDGWTAEVPHLVGLDAASVAVARERLLQARLRAEVHHTRGGVHAP